MKKWELREYYEVVKVGGIREEDYEVIAVFDDYNEAEDAALDQIYFSRMQHLEDDFFTEAQVCRELKDEDGCVFNFKIVPVQ